MESVEVAASNASMEKLLASESLSPVYKASSIGTDGNGVGGYGCLRPPGFSQTTPRKNADLESGKSTVNILITSSFKSMTTPPPASKQNNRKSDQSMKVAGGILEAGNWSLGSAQANARTEEMKNSGGKGNRCKDASRKRSRSVIFCSIDTRNMVNKGDRGSGEVTENVRKKTRWRAGSQSCKKGEKRHSIGAAAELPHKKHGLFPDANSVSKAPCILDIYGLKTRQVYLDRFMTELPLEDLLNGNLSSYKNKKVEVNYCESEPFLREINHILEQLPNWPGGHGTAPKAAALLSPHIIDDENSSMRLTSMPSVVKTRDEVAVDSQKIMQFGEEIHAAKHDQVEKDMTKIFSAEMLPLQSFEEFMNSLKLPSTEFLESFISRGTSNVEPGLAEPCTLLSNSSYCKSGKMPPFSFSLPLAGRSKTDTLHQESSNQEGQTKMTVKDNAILNARTNANGFKDGHFKHNTMHNLEIKSQIIKCKKKVEEGDIQNVEAPIQEKHVSSCSELYRTFDVRQSLENCPMGLSKVTTIEQSGQSGTASYVKFLESDALKETGGKITESMIPNTEEFSKINCQPNDRSECCKNKLQTEWIGSSTQHRSPEVHLYSSSYFMTAKGKCESQEKKIQTQAHLHTICGGSAKDAITQGKDATIPAASHDRLFPWLQRYCTNCYSKLSSKLPDQVVSPSVMEASILLYHMSNCTSPTELLKIRKRQQRVLQSTPAAQMRKAPKNLKLGPLTESSAMLSGFEQSQTRHKSSGGPTCNHKPPACDRRKSLTEVADFIKQSAESSTPTANMAGTPESNDLQGSNHTLGQSTIRSSKFARPCLEFSRENCSLTGKGAPPYKHLLNFDQGLVAKKNVSLLSRTQRRSIVDPTNRIRVGGNKPSHSFLSKDSLRGTTFKMPAQKLASLADSRSKAEPESTRRKSSKP